MATYKRMLPAVLVLALSVPATFLPAEKRDSGISSEEFLEPIKFLASPELKGRGDGTPELDRAADYLARRFHSFGLKPAGDNRTYLQHFTLTASSKLGPKNSIVVLNGSTQNNLTMGQDFLPLSFSGNTTFEAPMVFAGYGITAPEYGYDDYRSIDAKGKIAIVLRHEPQEFDEKSVFEGKQFTLHAELMTKSLNAKAHGALAMVLVNDVDNHPDLADKLIPFVTLGGPGSAGIAAVQAKAAIVNEWLKPSGQTLEALRQAIDRDLSNHSFQLDPSARLSLSTNVERVPKTVANVVGLLPGRSGECPCIVVGAHYDHLGTGSVYSLAPGSVGQVHPGADDNASGTSGVLALAHVLSRHGEPPDHSILFIAFAGEELGLLGSSYYAGHPVCPPDQTFAMINLDMIGRVSKNRLYVGGAGTSPHFRELVETANRAVGFELNYSASGYGASDHTSFTVRGVPVLFFFSGLHSDYHKPSDTWEKIDAADGARAVELTAKVVESIDGLTERPQFVRVQEPSPPAGGPGAGYGPYFGSIPDFGQSEHGVRFADIRDGSPAAKAGFKAGDILIEFGDRKIENLYDFTYALRAHKPGDKVQVTVLRNGERVSHEVALEVRK